MKRFILTAAATALIAGSASAEGISYIRLSYDYQSHTGEFGDPTLSFFQGTVDYELDEFVIGASFDSTSISSDVVDSDFQDLGISGAYVLSPEILGGAGFLRRSSDAGDSTAFELFAQYVTDSFGVAANHALLEDDETQTVLFGEYALNSDLVLGAIVVSESSADGTGYQISADYNAGSIEARAFISGDTDADGNVFGARAHYEFGDAYRIGAGFENISGAAFDDRTIQVGAGYNVIEGVWIDARVGQIDLEDSSTVDFLRLLVTYETGDRARLDNTMAQRSSDDIWAGVGPLFIF